MEKPSTKIERSYLSALACYPHLLAMMCFIWNETGDIPMRMTALYKQVVEAFAFQFYARNSGKTVSHHIEPNLDRVPLKLGPASLRGGSHYDE